MRGRLIGLGALMVLSSCGESQEQSKLTGWRKDVGQIRIGANIGEENPASLARMETYQKYISRSTGLPVKLFKAADYNGVIQALASGQLELATMGPAAYANARAQIGTKVEPILAPRSAEGLSGYYTTIAVRADSPYRSVNDLRGKTVGYVDFNSASGYVYPRWALKQQGIDADKFFGRSAVSGGHIQGILALNNGQFDAVFVLASNGTPETGFATGSIVTLAKRGLVEASDFRTIWAAGPIANSPYVLRTDRPQPMTDIIRGALASLPYDNPEIWAEIGMSEGGDMRPTQAADYEEIVAMRDAEVGSRRPGAAAL